MKKTTTARIIVKGLNCIGADGGGGPPTASSEPGVPCRASAEWRHVDVLFFFNVTATTDIYTLSYTLSLHDALPIFFFNDTATTEIYTLSYTLSLHDALPI